MTGSEGRRGAADEVDKDLDEALDESFPASDPPAMTEPGADKRSRPKPRRPARKAPERPERR